MPRSDPDPPVSIAATVFNEAGSIDHLIDSLDRQTRRPDEIVIVDGGSSDGTWERLRRAAGERRDGSAPLRVISRPGSNIAAGRNAAVAAARGPIVACTDAGVRLADDWLAAITAPLAGGARWVSGFFSPDPQSAFETALGATTLPEAADIDPARFLPSSRSVAFRKEDWAAAGGYPEWLDYCEDLVFDFRMLEAAGPAAFAPGAIARFRPRASLRAFARQYYLYARGDGKADLWAWRHVVRYGTYGVAAPVLVVSAVAGHWGAWLILAVGGLLMTRAPYRRLTKQWRGLPRTDRLRAALWVPIIRVTGDLAKMAGYPAGLWWRWRHRPPDWRPSAAMGRW